MKMATMIEPARFIPEGFLASTADLIGVFAHLAAPGSLHTRRHQHDLQLARAALAGLPPHIPTIRQLPPPAHVVPVAAPVPTPLRAVVSKAARTAERSTEARDGRYGPQGRQYCQCGRCRWCLDNVRWDRIFKERFASPAYYDRMVIRQSSPLAEVS